jgi:hypothetical protein
MKKRFAGSKLKPYIKTAFACTIASFTIVSKAQAEQSFLFSFDKVYGGGRIEEARLRITTEDIASTVNGFTGYLIKSVTGTDEGNSVTALLSKGFSDPLLTGLPTDNLFNPLFGTPAPGNQFSINGFAYEAGGELYQFYYGPFDVSSPSGPPDYQGAPCISYLGSCIPPRQPRPEIINVETSPVPAPGPLPLLGVGAAVGFSRKLRKRLKTSKTSEVINAIS